MRFTFNRFKNILPSVVRVGSLVQAFQQSFLLYSPDVQRVCLQSIPLSFSKPSYYSLGEEGNDEGGGRPAFSLRPPSDVSPGDRHPTQNNGRSHTWQQTSILEKVCHNKGCNRKHGHRTALPIKSRLHSILYTAFRVYDSIITFHLHHGMLVLFLFKVHNHFYCEI